MDLSKLSDADLGKLLRERLAGGGTEEKPKRPRKADRRIKFLTEDQFAALMKAAEKETRAAKPGTQRHKLAVRNVAILRLVYHRGLRASELGRIQFGDWYQNADADWIRFHRLKGSRGGDYRLVKSEVTALRAWRRVRGDDPGPLFGSREGGGIAQRMLDVLMKWLGAAAGIPRDLCHLHSLKHSCGTHLLNRGESLEDVQDQLGHRSLKSTEVYAQFTNVRRSARDKRLRDW